MYCKHCGKQISDDSTFCQYCGDKVDTMFIDETTERINSTSTPNTEDKSVENALEVVKSTKEESPIQVEVSRKGKNINSTIANEIVGNLKMVGIALCIFAFYMIGFMLIHSKDAKPLDENGYWGESCYDPLYMSSSKIFIWQQHYAMKIYLAPKYQRNGNNVRDNYVSLKQISAASHLAEGMNAEQALSYANQEAKEKGLPQSLLKQYEEEAKKDAQRDKESFNDEISRIRKYAYKDDLKKNATYAAIISLLVMILGRYIMKLFKWVDNNRTT